MKYLIILLVLVSLVGFNGINDAFADQTGKLEFVVDASNSGEGTFDFTWVGSGSVVAQSVSIDTSITNISDPISLIKNHENLQNFYVRIFNVPDNFITTNFECDASKIDLNESDRVTFKIVKNEEVKCTVHGAYVQSSTMPAQSDPQNGGNSDNNQDDTPPTLGMDSSHERIVDNGFTYNGNTVNVDHEYTEFPLLTTKVGEKNTMELAIYENYGKKKIKFIHYFIGLKDKDTLVSDAQASFGYHFRSTNSIYEPFEITDKEHILDNANMTGISSIECSNNDNTNYKDCLTLSFDYTYREAPKYQTFAIQLGDEYGNKFTHYFNEGITVIGESLNAPLKITNSGIDYLQIDKVNDIWTNNGIEYKRTSDTRFEIIRYNFYTNYK